MQHFDENAISRVSDEELLALVQSIGVDVDKITISNRRHYEQKLNAFFKKNNIHVRANSSFGGYISKKIPVFLMISVFFGIFGYFYEDFKSFPEITEKEKKTANFASENMGGNVFGAYFPEEGSLPTIFDSPALKQYTSDHKTLINVIFYCFKFYVLLIRIN